MNPATEKVLVRLRGGGAEGAIRIASAMAERVGGFVVGGDLLLGRGPILVAALRALGKPVLADLGILDRPPVVAKAVARMGKLGARWVSIPGLAGRKTIDAAVAEAAGYPELAVVVSAMQAGWARDEDLKGVGISDTPGSHVSRLTKLALGAGAGGILFPARELGVVVQVSETKQPARVGNSGMLTRISEVRRGISCSGITDAIRGGAHWVVATPEQVEGLDNGA